MKTHQKDPEREDRIHNEAIVDAYGPEEQAMTGITTWKIKSASRSRQSASPLNRPHHCGKEKWSKSAEWRLHQRHDRAHPLAEPEYGRSTLSVKCPRPG